MTEHERPSDSPAANRVWGVDDISRALNHLPQEPTDLAFGAGVRFRLGHQQQMVLELFRAVGVVRVTSPDMQIALLDQAAAPTVASTGITFTRDEPSHCSLMSRRTAH
jgi:hypothetical protein